MIKYFMDDYPNLDPFDRHLIKEIFENVAVINGTCWEWSGKRSTGSYGIYKGMPVHRLSYALFKGDFNKKSFICHHCDNPKCYRPEHLYEGDAKTNMRDFKKRHRHKSMSIYSKALE